MALLLAAPGGERFGLTVTDATSSDTLAEVAAPPPTTDPAQTLGDPAGLQTIFRAPPGQYDVILVYVGGYGSAAGDSGVMCRYSRGDTNGTDEVEMVDADTIDELARLGITPSFVSVAYHNEEISSSIFDEDIEVHAGRLLQIQYADLVP